PALEAEDLRLHPAGVEVLRADALAVDVDLGARPEAARHEEQRLVHQLRREGEVPARPHGALRAGDEHGEVDLVPALRLEGLLGVGGVVVGALEVLAGEVDGGGPDAVRQAVDGEDGAEHEDRQRGNGPGQGAADAGRRGAGRGGHAWWDDTALAPAT